MNTFTATEVKQGLSAVLNSALRAPVRITREDSYDFVLLSAAEYQRLAAPQEAGRPASAAEEAESLSAGEGADGLSAEEAERLEAMEDDYWYGVAQEAMRDVREHGAVGVEESAKIMQELMEKNQRLEDLGLG